MYTQLYRQIQRIQQVLKTGTVSDQDAVLSELHEDLCATPDAIYPSLWYSGLIEVLEYYCRTILPHTRLSNTEQRFVAAKFQQTIQRLHHQARTAQTLEVRIACLLRRLRQGSLPNVETLIQEIQRSAEAAFPPQIGATQERQEPAIPVSRTFTTAYRALQKAPWLAKHVTPFFDDLLQQFSFQHCSSFVALFRYQLAEWFQMPAVLVNTLNGQGIVSRLDITTTVVSGELDNLTFVNHVDEAMWHSALLALRVTRRYLDTHFPQMLKGQGMHVACRFANPAAAYNDRSVSLLLALKIVGDILEMELAPDTVVTGAVEASGRVMPVNHLMEKVATLEQCAGIQRLLYPTGNVPVGANRLCLEAVGTFEEALLTYYGDQLQRKLRQATRRQVLRSAAALATIPVGLLTFTNIFSNPVSEHDWRLLDTARELYQQKSDYKNAVVIFDALVNRFRKDSTTDSLRLKAQVLGYLGVIYTQQYQLAKSLHILQNAFAYWKSLGDNIRQAETLFRIGDVHRYAFIAGSSQQTAGNGLSYYKQGGSLLASMMKESPYLRGKYYGLLGYMYYWVGAYDKAEHYSRECIFHFDKTEEGWNYQTARQHLGRVLVKIGKYDHAYALLQETLQSSVLENPHDRVKGLWSLSDFFFSIGRDEEGLDFAQKTANLCQKFRLKGQQYALEWVLSHHQICLP